MTSNRDTSLNLDEILETIGGFGPYQRRILILTCIGLIVNSASTITYIFTAKDLSYRCEIPECEYDFPLKYKEPWIPDAIPMKDGVPEKCSRYAPAKNLTYSLLPNCSKQYFDTSYTIPCDSYAYESTDSIIFDFDIHCNENLWKIGMVGMVNNIAQGLSLLISGLISDRYGRKTAYILGLVIGGLIGLCRALAINYYVFLGIEFAVLLVSGGAYNSGYIIGMELMGPGQRILAGTIMAWSFAFGELLLVAVAWLIRDWRYMVLVTSILPVLAIIYCWTIPESVRWLLAKQREEKVKDILRKVAEMNGKESSGCILENMEIRKDESTVPFTEILKSKVLLTRFALCSCCWLGIFFLYFAFILNSVSLAGDLYLDFTLQTLVEFPGSLLPLFLVDRYGRRSSLSASLFITGVGCFIFIMIPKGMYWIQLSIYLLDKMATTAALTILAVVTNEIFPTTVRQSLFNFCTMIGSVGSAVAVQMPLLAQIWEPLMYVVFGIVAVIAGLLVLLLPETVNVKLPDTITEAENIGKETTKMEDVSKTT